jgi:thioredoxin reductase (NADPH)
VYDVLVIGGGPAGLAAALQLARYDRRVALFDTGHGRSTWHQVNHNYLGFPGGVAARRLRELGRQQLAAYSSVTVLAHKVESVTRSQEQFAAQGEAGTWIGRALILCTGVLDHYPHFEGWQEFVGRSIFWCITCDGYGAKGARVLVIGNTNQALMEAMQLSRFTRKLTVLTDSHRWSLDPAVVERVTASGIPIVYDRIERIEGHDGRLVAVYTQSGQRLALDQLFCEQGCTPQSRLAAQLGARLDAQGYVVVDDEQQTCVSGVFAAGDVALGHAHQIATAVHEGSTAASAANYYLYPPALRF